MTGASGAVPGVTFTAVDWGPGPPLLTAATVHETVVPLVNPDTVIGELGPLDITDPQVTL